MEKILEQILYPVGISNRYRGYPYFLMAVELASENLSRLANIQKEIYIPVALHYHVNPINVERDIRTIRDVIVRNGGPEFLKQLSGGSYHYTGTLYPTELIELFAKYYLHALRSAVK